MHPWLKRHRELLLAVDTRVGSIRSRYAAETRCRRGCALCCRGLFDISLPDAACLAEGLREHPGEVICGEKYVQCKFKSQGLASITGDATWLSHGDLRKSTTI